MFSKCIAGSSPATVQTQVPSREGKDHHNRSQVKIDRGAEKHERAPQDVHGMSEHRDRIRRSRLWSKSQSPCKINLTVTLAATYDSCLHTNMRTWTRKCSFSLSRCIVFYDFYLLLQIPRVCHPSSVCFAAKERLKVTQQFTPRPP